MDTLAGAAESFCNDGAALLYLLFRLLPHGILGGGVGKLGEGGHHLLSYGSGDGRSGGMV